MEFQNVVNMYNLFLDDFREPYQVGNYILPTGLRKLYRVLDWKIVRNYREFVNFIEKNGKPDLISFDHDLADGHYHKNMQEGVLNYETEDFESDEYKTGYHCAQWLIEKCEKENWKLPSFIVHSMNPVGTENIKNLLNNYLKNESKN